MTDPTTPPAAAAGPSITTPEDLDYLRKLIVLLDQADPLYLSDPNGGTTITLGTRSMIAAGLRRLYLALRPAPPPQKPPVPQEGIAVYCVARFTRPDGVRIFGKGPTHEAAAADLAARIQEATEFENDDPMPDWSALPTEPLTAQSGAPRQGHDCICARCGCEFKAPVEGEKVCDPCWNRREK